MDESAPQQTPTCSRAKIQTQEKGFSIAFSSVSTVDFEQVSVYWPFGKTVKLVKTQKNEDTRK